MLLGLSGHPGREEISKARRQMALMWHPVSWLKTGPEKESGHVSFLGVHHVFAPTVVTMDKIAKPKKIAR